MSLSIASFIDTMSAPEGLFRTLGVTDARRNIYDEIVFTAGNKAAVFRVRADGVQGELLLKCYVKPGGPSRAVYDYLSRQNSDILAHVRLLREEMYVYGVNRYVDVVVGEWVEGTTLEAEIELAARHGDSERFDALSRAFDSLALELLAAEWSHGDLKPENIVVAPDGRMKLIDCDALVFPCCPVDDTSTGQQGGNAPADVFRETGTEGYRHPLRGERLWDKSVDHYPIALIAATLRLLAIRPELYAGRGIAESVLFSPEAVIAGRSPLYDKVLALAADSCEANLLRLLRTLASPTPRIDNLPEVISPPQVEGHSVPFRSDGFWGYATPDGRTVVAPVFDSAAEFTEPEGLAATSLAGKPHFIDRRGRVAINCSHLEAVNSFSEGLAAFRRDGMWGYMNTAGREAIAPRYEAAAAMHEGYAAVKLGGKWGYIDSRGCVVVEPKHDYAGRISGGRGRVELAGESNEIAVAGGQHN
ncbi:MAG: WG repeat-containing protein [Rikenellaceae bacterium]|jgi:hypothetical protein|nr:WG repeat-containing protein [Rikenellaceae bacterium]